MDSTLKSNENPYKILRVPNTVTKNEIKERYKELVRLNHPDLSKDPKSEKNFMKINDAYELLMDDHKREIFDRYGIVNHDDVPRTEVTTHDLDYTNYHDLSDVLNKYGDFVLYSSPRLEPVFVYVISEVAKEFGKKQKFFLHDRNADDNALIDQFIDSKYENTIVYYYRDCNSNIRFKKFTLKHTYIIDIDTLRYDLKRWVEECWNTNIHVLGSYSAMKKWLKKNKQICIVYVTKFGESSLQMRRNVVKFQSRVKYALLNTDLIEVSKDFNLTGLPTIMVFYGSEFISECKSFSIASKKYCNKLIFEFSAASADNVMKMGNNYVYCHIGNLPRRYYETDFTIPVGIIPPKSTYAKKLNLSQGEWIIIQFNKEQYGRIPGKDFLQEFKDFKGQTMIKKEKLPYDFYHTTLLDRFYSYLP